MYPESCRRYQPKSCDILLTVVGGAFSENLGKALLNFGGRVSTTPVQVREAEACAFAHISL
jgi:hypothetical protein